MKLCKSPKGEIMMEVSANSDGILLKAWGTTFNELDWDALISLDKQKRGEIMHNLFSPDGDLKFTKEESP